MESVGGEIDISTKVGEGTTFTLKLPVPKSVLIINSLLVEANKLCFAIPQDSIIRILRIEPEQAKLALVQISSGYILRWNQTIYPLLSLKMALNMEKTPKEFQEPGVLEILIVRSGNLHYALYVDAILDSEEIVVKRLQPYFNINGIYTGATFMGDGSIGLILDIKGIAEKCGLKSQLSLSEIDKVYKNSIQKLNNSEGQNKFENYLLFQMNTKAFFGVPLPQVYRLEEIEVGHIQYSGTQEVCIYREGLMPLYCMNELLGYEGIKCNLKEEEKISLIVVKNQNSVVGLKISNVVDIVEVPEKIDPSIRDRKGFVGNVFVKEQTVTVVDLEILFQLYQTQKSTKYVA